MTIKDIKEAKKTMIKAVHCSILWREFYKHDRTAYEILLKNEYAKNSSKELTTAELSDLLDILNNKPRKPIPATRPGKVASSGKLAIVGTANQKNKISILKELVKWKKENGFDRWVSARRLKSASAIINGLKSMIKHQMCNTYGPNWSSLKYDDERLNMFVKYHGADA